MTMARVLLGLCALWIAMTAAADDWLYRMRPGDTIWNLSHELLKDPLKWQAVQRYNHVREDHGMPVGSVLRIPENWLVMQAREAVVASVSGEARVIDGDSGEAIPLRADHHLGERDLVITGDDGGASVRLPDGSLVLIGPKSRVRVDRLREYGRHHAREIRLRLERGEIENRVRKKHLPSDRFEIETPAAVTAVRGTAYRLRADAKQSGAEVLEGRVGVANPLGRVSVAQGFGTVARADQPPNPPRQLLPAPRLRVEAEQRHPKLEVAWDAVHGAVAYQVEVGRDADFIELAAQRRVESPRAAFAGLPDGDYHLRVRAIDSIGLRGRDAVARATLDAHPLMPELLAPPDGSHLMAPQVDLRWRAGDGQSRAYRLQLASDGGFTHPLIDRVLDETHFAPAKPLSPGPFAWRVAAIAADGDQGLFSEARHFIVDAPPSPPLLRIDDLDQGQHQHGARLGSTRHVVLHLPKPAPGTTYELRLSGEPDGAYPIWTRVVDGGDIDLVLRDPGVAWLRARRVEDGVASAFSEPLRFENPSDIGRWLPLLGGGLMLLF